MPKKIKIVITPEMENYLKNTLGVQTPREYLISLMAKMSFEKINKHVELIVKDDNDD